jgi:response regulator RpfG family c-di-GMP phosphodiesterase
MSRKDVAILIVDDEESLRKLLCNFLGDEYACMAASNADEAAMLLELRPFNLVLSDITMPGATGLELCQLVSKMCPETVVVMVSAMTDIDYAIEAMRQGAFDYVTKPFSFSNLLLAVERALRYQELLVTKYRHEQILAETVQARTEELRVANRNLSQMNSRLNNLIDTLYSSYHGTLRVLAGTLETRDFETRGHSDRVVANCLRLGKEMGLGGAELIGLAQGALLHDIGKIGVPDSVLLKTGALTDDERDQMRQHISHGLRIIDGIDFLSGARPVVAQHHERYDGSGYPDGLRGDAIHIYARIFAVADALDAITSDRPYRGSQSYLAARDEIARNAGTQFDPEVVEAFLRVPETEWAGIGESADQSVQLETLLDKEQIHSLILSLNRHLLQPSVHAMGVAC